MPGSLVGERKKRSSKGSQVHIYRSQASRRIVQQWCSDELDRLLPLVERRIIDTSLGPTHLTTTGTGPRVVLLPGTNFGAATSTPVIAALSWLFQVTVVDLPGQPGLSSDVRVTSDLVAAHRRWWAEVHARLGDGPVLVVGESLGAAVALCAEPGPGISGVVLVVPAGLVGARVDAGILAASVPWMLSPTTGRADRLLTTMDGGAHLPDREQLVEWLAMIPTHVHTSLAPAPLPNQVLVAWQGTPLQVVAGGKDRFFPGRRLATPAQQLLHAATTIVPSAGHLLTHSEPGAVAKAVADVQRHIEDVT